MFRSFLCFFLIRLKLKTHNRQSECVFIHSAVCNSMTAQLWVAIFSRGCAATCTHTHTQGVNVSWAVSRLSKHLQWSLKKFDWMCSVCLQVKWRLWFRCLEVSIEVYVCIEVSQYIICQENRSKSWASKDKWTNCYFSVEVKDKPVCLSL